MILPFLKASALTGSKKRKKKSGGQQGHPGVCCLRPEKLDRQEEHRLNCYLDCGGPLQPCNGKSSVRTRIVEDIPADIQAVDCSQGSPALKQLFKETFEGILVTDFWAAYDAILGG